MKIFAISDLHIGKLNNIEYYYEKELLFFISQIYEKKPDIIVICGDLFDKRILMNSTFALYCNLFINKIAEYVNEKENRRLYLIRGTLAHDYNQLNSYKYLTNNKIKIFNTSIEEIYNESRFLILPEEYESNKYEYYKDSIFNKNKKYDFVFGHGMFNFAGGYVTESGKNNHIVFDVNDFKNKVYGLVMFGHIHIRMIKDNCEYIGSFSRYNFGEEEPKGFLYINYDNINKNILEKEFIINKNAPIYKTINVLELSEENIFNEINNIFKTCDKLRVIINSDISEKKFNDLKSMTYENKNLFILKKMKGLSKSEEDKKNKELEQRRNERKELLNKYNNKNFFEITKMIAKDKYNTEISIDEINESLS